MNRSVSACFFLMNEINYVKLMKVNQRSVFFNITYATQFLPFLHTTLILDGGLALDISKPPCHIRRFASHKQTANVYFPDAINDTTKRIPDAEPEKQN